MALANVLAERCWIVTGHSKVLCSCPRIQVTLAYTLAIANSDPTPRVLIIPLVQSHPHLAILFGLLHQQLAIVLESLLHGARHVGLQGCDVWPQYHVSRVCS